MVDDIHCVYIFCQLYRSRRSLILKVHEELNLANILDPKEFPTFVPTVVCYYGGIATTINNATIIKNNLLLFCCLIYFEGFVSSNAISLLKQKKLEVLIAISSLFNVECAFLPSKKSM
jgi:hypothetical protein